MKEDIEIEGWRCRLVREQRSAQNYTLEVGARLMPDGSLQTTRAETDGSEVTVTVPAAVLAWLVAPLIDRGHATGKRSALGADQSAPTETAWEPRIGESVVTFIEREPGVVESNRGGSFPYCVRMANGSLQFFSTIGIVPGPDPRLAHALANPPGPRGPRGGCCIDCGGKSHTGPCCYMRPGPLASEALASARLDTETHCLPEVEPQGAPLHSTRNTHDLGNDH